jgi:hypothetical protein
VPRRAKTLRRLTVHLLAALAALWSAGGAVAAPPPRADFTIRPACAAPAPGEAACLALALASKTAAVRARAHPLARGASPQAGSPQPSECAEDYPSTCLSPQDLRDAYLPGVQPEAPASEPQTVALVDAYNDPEVASDLVTYEKEFGIECAGQDCFEQVNGSGEAANLPFPTTKAELEKYAKGTSHQRLEAEEAEGWALEIATDVEVTRAICQNCHILLIEAASPNFAGPNGLEAAEDTAVTLQATEISDSWGGPDTGAETPAFNHPGIPITAAAGDDGYLNWDQYAGPEQQGSPNFESVNYPASSAHVISVGGTSMTIATDGSWQAESAWNLGGGGCSTFNASEWQLQVSDWAQVGCGRHRASADIAADADPSTGMDIFDSTPYPEEEEGKKIRVIPYWAPIGGTSVAAPIIASMFALAGGAHSVAYPAQTLYSHLQSSSLHDVSSGGNGECDDEYAHCNGSLASPLDCGAGAWICNATTGYDGPTGVGTPNGIGAFELSGEGVQKSKTIEEQPPVKATPEGLAATGNPAQQSGASGGGSGASSPSSSSGGATTTAPSTKLGSATKGAGVSPRVSGLTLTARARTALRAARTAISSLAFSFKLNRAATVRVALAIQVRNGTRTRWHNLRSSLTFKAVKGLDRRRLHGSAELAPGLYRLTLTPSGGPPRSIAIRVS